MGQFEGPEAPLLRPGEGPAFVAKELTFDQP